MRKVHLINILAIVLTVVVLGTAFALYRRDATDRKITIGFGEIVELSISNSAETAPISPDNSTQTVTVLLSSNKVNGDTATDLYSYGRFYVAVIQKTQTENPLANQLEFTATVGDKTLNHSDLVMANDVKPQGYVASLSGGEISLTLTYSLSDVAKQNFIDYAEQEVSLMLYWEFCEAPGLVINVSKQWETDVYYYQYATDTPVSGSLRFEAGQYWATLTVPTNVTQIQFAADEKFSNPVTIILTDNTANQIWVSLNDESFSTVPPE